MLKVLRPDVPPHWAEREADLTRAVRRRGVRAPEVRAVSQVDGRAAIEFERIDGPSLWDLLVEDPSRVGELMPEFVALHRQIMAAGLPEHLPDLMARLCGKIEEAPTLSPTERAEAVEMAQSLSRGAALLHGDYHPGNVLMSQDGPVVIDWFDAVVGHPVADIVRSSLLVRPSTGSSEIKHLPGADVELLRCFHENYVSAFEPELVRCGPSLRTWEAVLAAARLVERAEDTEANLLRLWHNYRDDSSTSASPLIELLPDLGAS